MRYVWTLLIATVVVGVATGAFVYSGQYDVSARSAHSGPVRWLLSTTSESAIRRQASSIAVPDLDEERLATAGINDYEVMCVNCHGAPGRPTSALALGLNPPAPDLSQSARSKSPAELFWVTKYGIKMTGMPAWGASHDDAELWPVVALVMQLPELDEQGYRELLAAASGMGHHTDDLGHIGEPGHNHPEAAGHRDDPGNRRPSADAGHHENSDEGGTAAGVNDAQSHDGHSDHDH